MRAIFGARPTYWNLHKFSSQLHAYRIKVPRFIRGISIPTERSAGIGASIGQFSGKALDHKSNFADARTDIKNSSAECP
jgi:hypothetical protein